MDSATRQAIPWGTKRVIDGRERVFYDGYWIKAYKVPTDTLLHKKRLIEALTRRLFNHVEHGLNVPGTRLEEAREAFEAETDEEKKRVKGGMLAGALFNRAADIFTKLVEFQALGVQVQSSNPLMRKCGEHLKEALELGKLVRHRGGDEGIDELWGEPFKAFAFPIEDFYKSRYIKIAMAMLLIDKVTTTLIAALQSSHVFAGIEPLVRTFAEAAKAKSETLRTDPDIFDVWASFVVASERLLRFEPAVPTNSSASDGRFAADGMLLIRGAVDLITHMARARVPMPKSAGAFIERCEQQSSLFAQRSERVGVELHH